MGQSNQKQINAIGVPIILLLAFRFSTESDAGEMIRALPTKHRVAVLCNKQMGLIKIVNRIRKT